MKKIIPLVFLLIFLLFLFGCNDDIQSSSNEATVENELNERIEVLEAELKALEKSIEEINNNAVIDREETTANYGDTLNMINSLFHLVENLPDVNIKEGYILDYVDDDERYFILDYAEFIEDDNEPNGFRIGNEVVEYDKVLITEKLDLYIGEYASDQNFPSKIIVGSEEIDLEDMKQGFYRFYYIEEELILVQRIYIP